MANMLAVLQDVFVNVPANQATRAAHVTFLETLSMLSADQQSLRPVRFYSFSLKLFATS